MAGRYQCASGFPKGRKPSAKRPTGRDVCGVKLRAHGESCMLCDPAIVHGEDERLYSAFFSRLPTTCLARLNASTT